MAETLPPPDGLVVLEGVSVTFQARGQGFFGSVPIYALREVSLTLGRGEVVAIVGESGSGKTTLGRVSLRLIPPSAGRVLFAGEDITEKDESYLRRTFRRQAQAIFQDPFSSLDSSMSVGQGVEEPLLVHRHSLGLSAQQRRERVLQALNRVGLAPAEEFAAKFPHMLSGGQRQRVAIARALVLEPIYVVADEPVSMIDASSRAGVLDLMRTLQQDLHISFLYITHDLATVRHFAQRVAILYLGRVVEAGPTASVLEGPLHPYCQLLIAAVPEPDPANRLRKRAVVPGEPPQPSRIPGGCPFHPRCPRFMRGVCEVAEPPLLAVRPGHWVACYLYP